MIAYLDIETLPVEPDDAAWIAHTGTIPDAEHLTTAQAIETARIATSFDPTWGRVLAIGIAIDNADPEVIWSWDRADELAALRLLFGVMSRNDRPAIVAHNGKRFDIPFLRIRALHHKADPLVRMLGGGLAAKPWEIGVRDTLELWPSMGWTDNAKPRKTLDTICRVLGIEQQAGLMGGDMYDAWKRGDRAGIESHLIADVNQLRAVYSRLGPLA